MYKLNILIVGIIIVISYGSGIFVIQSSTSENNAPILKDIELTCRNGYIYNLFKG